MSRRPLTLFWRTFLTITVVAGTLILLGNTLVRYQYQHVLLRQELADMEDDGHMLALWSARHLMGDESLRQTLGDLTYIGSVADQRLWLVDRQGRVLFDAVPDSGWVGQRLQGAELLQVMAGREGNCLCADPWLHARAYVAVPVYRVDSQEVLGAVLLFSQTQRVNAIMDTFLRIVDVAGMLSFLFAVALSLWMSRRLVRPLERIVPYARQLGRGEWSQQLAPEGALETRQLAESLNQAAAELQAMFEARELERRRLETIVAEMAEGVLATDGHGNLVLANRAARTLLGLPAGGAVHIQDLPDDLSVAIAQAQTRGEEHQRVSVTHHGLELVVLISAVGRETALGAVAVVQDLTQERRLVQMGENFVANVSHELRSPLATLGAGLEAIQDGVIPIEQQNRYRSLMLGEVRRLRRLTDDLLELSRLDAGTLRVDLEPVPLHTVVADLQTVIAPRVLAAGLQLLVDVPLGLVGLVDRDRLEQVLGNLVDNALRFTPAGGRVVISGRAAGDRAEILVTDTGVGIDPESLPFIFDRFFKVDLARVRRDSTGTGLGLAIVQQLVEAMGGHVTVTSQAGQGTVFVVSLCRSTEEAVLATSD